jgi:mevalonate kinase
LLGDNADLIEKPAIAAAVSAYLKMELTKRKDDRVILTARDIGFQEEFRTGDRLDFNSPLKYVKAVFQRLKNRVDSGFSAVINSGIPIGAGLSSSAALCIASIRVLSKAYGIPLLPGEIAELAFEIESHDLQVECGRMDQYAIAFGGITFIHTGEEAGVENLPADSLPVVVADTLEKHNTKQLQVWLRQRIESKEKLLLDSLSRVVDIVEKGREALLKGDLGALGALMNEQQTEEKIMGTSTDRLERYCSAARNAGALGAKQMGAGGGGCIVALCPGERLKNVKSALESLRAPTWAFQIVED